MIYLDDIVIFSNTIEEHMEHIKKVTEGLRTYNLAINFLKTKFFKQEIEYLGYLINRDGVKITNEKIELI